MHTCSQIMLQQRYIDAFLYSYIHTYMHIYTYTHTHIYTHMPSSIHVIMHLYRYIDVHAGTWLKCSTASSTYALPIRHMNTFVCTDNVCAKIYTMHSSMHMYTCICTFTHTHTHHLTSHSDLPPKNGLIELWPSTNAGTDRFPSFSPATVYKTSGTRGAIQLSSTFEEGDPKWDCNRLLALRRSQDWFLRPKIERFFWRDFSGENFLEQHYCPYNFVPIN